MLQLEHGKQWRDKLPKMPNTPLPTPGYLGNPPVVSTVNQHQKHALAVGSQVECHEVKVTSDAQGHQVASPSQDHAAKVTLPSPKVPEKTKMEYEKLKKLGNDMVQKVLNMFISS